MRKAMKKIVCLGGGNAMPKAVLTGLKKYPVKLSVICAMLDTGGSAGRERKDYKTNISFGDIRRCYLALSESSPDVKDAFKIRFKEGPYQGIVIANILGTAVAKQTGDYEKAFRVYEEVLKVPSRYQVFPSTLDNANLYAVLENKKIIFGETNIDIPKHDGRLKIKKVFLKPKARAYPKSIRAIKEADLIVIGPGDMYSSLAQILLTQGIPEAIKKSEAKTAYVCNLMTKYGETNKFSVLDFTEEIEKYLGRELDFVIYNTARPTPGRFTAYKKTHPELLKLVDIDKKAALDKRFIGGDVLSSSGEINHDPDKLAKILIKLCLPR